MQAVSTRDGHSWSASSSLGDGEDHVLAYKALWTKETGLRELREEIKRLKSEGKSQQCSLRSEVRMQGRMRTARRRWTTKQTVVKKLEMRKITKELHEIGDFNSMDEDFKKGQKWQKELAQIEQRKMTCCQNMKRAKKKKNMSNIAESGGQVWHSAGKSDETSGGLEQGATCSERYTAARKADGVRTAVRTATQAGRGRLPTLSDRSGREPSHDSGKHGTVFITRRKSKNQVGISKLEMIRSASFPFAENACDEGGRKKFALLETKRGIKVEEIGRFLETLQENQDRNHWELPEANGYMNARQSGLLAAMERKKEDCWKGPWRKKATASSSRGS